MLTRMFIFIIFFLNISNVFSANILAIMPFPAYSHHVPYNVLFSALANRGHNFTVLTSHPFEDMPKNYNQIVIPRALHKWNKNEFLNPEGIKAIKIYDLMMHGVYEMCKFQLQSEEFQNFLRLNDTFDLIFYTSITMNAYLSLFEKYKNTPVIGILSLGNFIQGSEIIGNPMQLSINPFYISPYSTKMTFFERVWNCILIFYHYYIFEFHLNSKYRTLIRDYIKEEYSSISFTSISNVSLLFDIKNEITSELVAEVPGIVNIGGIHIGQRHENPLTQEQQEFLDGAQEGFIYISLGSNFKWSFINVEIKETFISVLNNTKLRVLWKDDDLTQKNYNKFFVSKWLPQERVLNHPNIRLFITQGGLLSTQESIYFGVPLLGIPLAFDQKRNLNILKEKGVALYLLSGDMNYNKINQTINEMLNNKRYKMCAEELSRHFRDRPISILDNAIWWTEYILRHKGAPHLKSPYLEQSWLVQLNLDIYFFFLAIFLSIIIILTYTIRFIIKLVIKKTINNKIKRA